MQHKFSMQVPTPTLESLLKNPFLLQIYYLFQHNGHDLRLVGGCVRDALLGKISLDIDMATPALPEQVRGLLSTAGISFHQVGIEHGTITAIFPSLTVQITTLRCDHQTNGRHAIVNFTTDWAADAARRDFTINAIYLDFFGNLYDPFGGGDDLQQKLLRFIGSPGKRIQEDYLRILRYFRLSAQLGFPIEDPPYDLQEYRFGLQKLSRERIRSEMLKLLATHVPFPALHAMTAFSIDTVLFSATFSPFMENLMFVEKQIQRQLSLWGRFFLLFLEHPEALETLVLRRVERQYLATLRKSLSVSLLQTLYIYGAKVAVDKLLLQFVMTGEVPQQSEIHLCDTFKKPHFPITGDDLMACGLPRGKQLGLLLKACEIWWINTNFSASRDVCLSYCLDQLC